MERRILLWMCVLIAVNQLGFGAVLAWAIASLPTDSIAPYGIGLLTAGLVLAALCADDESLQDDEAWTALLDGWSHGERLTLWIALHNLNELAPAPFVPKG